MNVGSGESVSISKLSKLIAKITGFKGRIYFDKNLNRRENKINKYLNVSFVMKKSIGNAVQRNRIKRKLKSAVQKISKRKQLIDLNYTYVIFGKNNVYKDEFELVLNEVNKTFKKIKQMAVYQ